MTGRVAARTGSAGVLGRAGEPGKTYAYNLTDAGQARLRGRNVWAMSMRKRQTVPAALAVAACGVLAGCVGATATHSTAHASRTPTALPGAPTALAGAPTAFAGGKGVPLPSAGSEDTGYQVDQSGTPPFALAGDTVFATTGTSLVVMSAATGRMIGSVRPTYSVPDPAGPEGGNLAAPAQVEDLQGRQVGVVGYVVELPGHGTTPPTYAVEVDAVDASAQRLWQLVVPLSIQPSLLTGNPTVTFAGSAGSDVVAVVGDDDDGYTTLAFDLAGRRLLWQSPQFLAEAVVGNTVVGTFDTSAPSGLGTHNLDGQLHLAAVSMVSGKTDWEQTAGLETADVQYGGPDTAVVEAVGYTFADEVIWLVHVNTGVTETLSSQPSNETDDDEPWACKFDGQQTVVCNDESVVFGLDGSTGRVLWQLPDTRENRVAPTVTAVYDGEIYGYTSSGPVVLDARTGNDVNDSPGVAPVVVDPEVGIAVDNGTVVAYPATR